MLASGPTPHPARAGPASLGGFPALSVVPGQFIIKDLVLLAAALWSLGEALPEAQP